MCSPVLLHRALLLCLVGLGLEEQLREEQLKQQPSHEKVGIAADPSMVEALLEVLTDDGSQDGSIVVGLMPVVQPHPLQGDLPEEATHAQVSQARVQALQRMHRRLQAWCVLFFF